MTNGKFRFFIDSNVIINYFYGDQTAKELIEISEKAGEIFINGIVLTEVVIRYLKDVTGEKSYTLKRKPELIRAVDKAPLYAVISKFLFLSDNVLIGRDAISLMDAYGLLPNDAVILATCKFYGIKYLISFDEDFKDACSSEGIVLINSVKKLSNFLK